VRAVLLASAIAVLVCADPAVAKRVADYSVGDEKLMQWGLELSLNPIAALPTKSSRNVALEIAPGVDHDAIRGGIYCSAWKVENPIAQLIGNVASQWDSDGKLASGTEIADVMIKVDRASTLTRCVGSGELAAICITRVAIEAQVTEVSAQTTRPVRVSIERSGPLKGLCSGLARSVAVVSRESAIALIKAVGTDEVVLKP
jgi:hypothetical protein